MDNRKPKQDKQKTNPKTYLHPNHVRKSKTEFVLALLYRLAQVHKLEIKLILILWAEVTSFSNAQPVSSTPESPKQTRGGCCPHFFPLLSHGDFLPR